MLKNYLFFLAVFFIPGNFLFAQTVYNVAPGDIRDGYINKRIELKHFTMPQVELTAMNFMTIEKVPDKVEVVTRYAFKTSIGKEQKRPFAIVSIPAYSLGTDGQYKRLVSFTLDIKEGAAQPPTASKGTAGNAVLSAGSWYKLAIKERGIYKIDYAFLSRLGISGNINAADIRLFGNGGTMLSEKNADPRPADLTENAIAVYDGGDGVFNGNDYFLFYANGPMAWEKDSTAKKFHHRKHLYEDSSYYFITVNQGKGLRIPLQSAVPAANVTVTSFNDYAAYEEDLTNPGKFGKQWLGEQLGTLTKKGNTASFNFNTGNVQGNINVEMSLAGRSNVAGSYFTATVNGQSVNIGPFGSVGLEEDNDPYDIRQKSFDVPGNGTGTNIQLVYTATANDAIGYVNYIELNYRRSLSMAGGLLPFRDWESVGLGKVAGYQLEGGGNNFQVWDITDPLSPVKMNGTMSGTRYTFARDAASLHEFVAIDETAYKTAFALGNVPNQNIHGHDPVDFIIVTNKRFLDAAERLAEHHRNREHLRVLVVTPEQVYNEFSSGSQDISAIRDMVRMFYDRAGSDESQMPKNLLLFGDASYDYRNRVSGNTNFVPTFESAESRILSSSYVVDEFYALLDDNEYIENLAIPNMLDIGVGRLPVSTPEEAKAIVDKIIAYTSPESLGPWRLNNTYIGDNEDLAGSHLTDAETMCTLIGTRSKKLYNSSKVYLDNLNFKATPGGTRCPDANKLINDGIFKGTFLVNYTGHGNIYTMADERILTADDFNTWRNLHKLPFMITATCDFSRYDNPAYVSAGEKLINSANGGSIAMLTTTALVFADDNKILDSSFLDVQFRQQNGKWYSFGEAYRKSKNMTYEHPRAGALNTRAFILLGDPALTPAFPEHFVYADSLIDEYDNTSADTLKALGRYRISGHVADVSGNVLTGFNGKAYIRIYDKARKISLVTKVKKVPREFEMQENIIYKGVTTVTNGYFSSSFITPKDVDYNFGTGRVSLYAENGVTDGAGVNEQLVVGGISDNPISDDDDPIVKPYMNDTSFLDGAITGPNSILHVQLSDESGINVSGLSIGHDMVAILDGQYESPYILNDYYETEPNTYKRGFVNFPVNNLPEGLHRFEVRAWDVNNNSGWGHVNFRVINGKIIVIDNLRNYPNPFRDMTHFVFEHNHPNEKYHVELGIYSMDGRRVRVIKQDFIPSGSRTSEIMWDGTDNQGAKLPSGVYPYKIVLSTEKGIESAAYQKLVLIR